MTPLVIGLLFFLLALGLFLYTWTFVFLVGTGPSGKAYDNFVMQICSSKGRSAFMKTTWTWGYYKRSLKQCIRYYKLKLFPVPVANLGKTCPDATLIGLDGKEKSLLKDYILQLPTDMPLILNMGSCS
jgi:hypothetical protein